VKRIPVFLLFVLAFSSAASGLDWQAVDAEIAFTWQYNAQLDNADPDSKYPSILQFNLGAAFYADWDGESTTASPGPVMRLPLTI